jgi:hypothetical protein
MRVSNIRDLVETEPYINLLFPKFETVVIFCQRVKNFPLQLSFKASFDMFFILVGCVIATNKDCTNVIALTCGTPT